MQSSLVGRVMKPNSGVHRDEVTEIVAVSDGGGALYVWTLYEGKLCSYYTWDITIMPVGYQGQLR